MDRKLLAGIGICLVLGLAWSSVAEKTKTAEGATGAKASSGVATAKKANAPTRKAGSQGGSKAAVRAAGDPKAKKAAAKADGGVAPKKQDVTQATAAKKPAADAKPKGFTRQPLMYVAETDLYIAKFIDQGGTLFSFELKKYKTADEKKQKDLIIAPISDPASRSFAVELVGHPDATKGLYALHDCVLTLQDDRKTAKTLTCTWKNGDKLELVKRVHFKNGSYLMDVEIELKNLSKTYLTTNVAFQMTSFQGAVEGGGCFQPPPDVATPSCLIKKSIESESIEDIVKKKKGRWPYDGPVEWGGVDMRYFITAGIPKDAKDADGLGPLTTSRCELVVRRGNAVGARVIPRRQLRVPGAGKTGLVRFSAYMGPKEHRVLEAVQVNRAGAMMPVGLERSVDFWILGFICKPMLWLLNLFYSWFGNFGWAIILLTLVVKVITFWPSQKSYRSMEQMKKLKGPMEEIRAKYKGDKSRMNQEMMALYKTHKINPLGGCLPMLLQMPIWIALYRTIYSSVEIYQQPFFGWIHDLSAKDPYYVLPILLGVVMFVQQRMAPTTADSTQMKLMMYGMPLLFTGMMLFFPAGLVLYIFVNTVLSIGQQWLIRRGMQKTNA